VTSVLCSDVDDYRVKECSRKHLCRVMLIEIVCCSADCRDATVLHLYIYRIRLSIFISGIGSPEMN